MKELCLKNVSLFRTALETKIRNKRKETRLHKVSASSNSFLCNYRMSYRAHHRTSSQASAFPERQALQGKPISTSVY